MPVLSSDPARLAPGVFAEVASGATLDVRKEATMDGEVVDVLTEDSLVYISDRGSPPNQAWFRVEYFTFADEPVFGWVQPEPPNGTLHAIQMKACPQAEIGEPAVDVEVGELAGMTPPEMLECFGTSTITIAAAVAEQSEFPEALYAGSPAWLAERGSFRLLGFPGRDAGAVPVHIDPGLGEIPLGQWIAVTARFDHSRSPECVRTPRQRSAPIQSEAEQILWCRQQLVITGFGPSAEPTPPREELPPPREPLDPR